jgi:hypothetical protein
MRSTMEEGYERLPLANRRKPFAESWQPTPIEIMPKARGDISSGSISGWFERVIPIQKIRPDGLSYLSK